MTSLSAPRIFTNSKATAAAYDHGAHVTSWTPSGLDPVLWMSNRSQLEAGQPIRGGVPICFPWFGMGRELAQFPAHGYARISVWEFLDATDSAEGTTATWRLQRVDRNSLDVTYTAMFGRELRLSLSVANNGNDSVTFESALHTYLAVDDIRSVTIHGLEGAPFLDKLSGTTRNQEGALTFEGETDRVYSSQGSVILTDELKRRRIRVERNGSANVVVWNPWVVKSAAMPDFGDDEWPSMVCIEAANVLDDAITLAPGASHTMTYTLNVETL